MFEERKISTIIKYFFKSIAILKNYRPTNYSMHKYAFSLYIFNYNNFLLQIIDNFH